MAVSYDSLTSMLDRAAQEPALLAELAANPLAVVQRLGVQVSAEDIKELLGIAGASDLELVEVLRARLANRREGCGGCTPDT